MPTTTSAITYGTKMSTRMSDCPRILRLSSRASSSATGPWISSDITTMNALWPSASWKSGSVRIVT